ncbi:hypothetical protein VaNZ11_013450 [Volvox africanus]|uniref:RING-type E3 ubiquitin transferase n=1 Tax=Volvox africanus TaxID=51714 RepID=A0ABQ5SI67_9CHLO|nr:hypothetical protein VaNZ11_013450 [Volvox africanus]
MWSNVPNGGRGRQMTDKTSLTKATGCTSGIDSSASTSGRGVGASNASASAGGAACPTQLEPIDDDLPPLLSDNSYSGSADEGGHEEDEARARRFRHGDTDDSEDYDSDKDTYNESDQEDDRYDYMASFMYEEDPSLPAVHRGGTAAATPGKAAREPLDATLQDVPDDDEDGSLPELVSSSDDEPDPRLNPFARAASRCEAVPGTAPAAKAAPILRKGFFDAHKVAATKKAEPASVKTGGKSAPQPKSQSAQLPSSRPSMPYSNAGVGIRENVRSGLPQRNKPVDAGRAQTHSAQHCSYPARAAAAAATPDDDDDDDDDDMPMLLHSDDDELDVYGADSSSARQACTRNMAATPAGAAAAQPGLASSRVSAPKAASRSAPPVPPAAQQRSSTRRTKESRKGREAPSFHEAPMNRSDFTNDSAWQQHLASEREERKRLRRERGLVESEDQGAVADIVLGYCCLRPGNDTDHLCDEPGYKVKETQRRYHLQCTRGCSLLFHDKCWRPFADGIAQLRGDEFDRNFKANTKEGKPKLHRCVTDCCDGHISRVYIFQAPEVPGAKPGHELYCMDPVARQLAAVAEAAKRRKRLANEGEAQASAGSNQQATKKSRKAAGASSRAPAAPAASATAAARAARREDRRRAAAEAAAAAAATGAGQDGGQEGTAQPETAQGPTASRPVVPRGISIVVRARSMQKDELEGPLRGDVNDESAGSRLGEDWTAPPAPHCETDFSESAQQTEAAAPRSSTGDCHGDMGTGTSPLPPVLAATAAASTKKKKKGYTMHLDEFNAVTGGGGGSGSGGTAAAGTSGAVSAATAAMAAASFNSEAAAYALAAEEGYHMPQLQPLAQRDVRYSGFPTLSAAMEQWARPIDVPQEDYVMEALSKLRLDERQGGSTNIILLERLDVRFLEKQQTGSEGYLRSELETYGGVVRLHVFREQECAAVEMEMDDVAYNVFVIFRNRTIGSKRPLVCFLRDFPTEEVLSRHIQAREEGIQTVDRVRPDPRLATKETWAPMPADGVAASMAMLWSPSTMQPKVVNAAQLDEDVALGTSFPARAALLRGPIVAGKSGLPAGGLPPRALRAEEASPSRLSPSVSAYIGAVAANPLTIPTSRKKVLPIIDTNTREVVNKEAVESVGSAGTPGTDPVARMAAAIGGGASRSAAGPGAGAGVPEASADSCEDAFARAQSAEPSLQKYEQDQQPLLRAADSSESPEDGAMFGHAGTRHRMGTDVKMSNADQESMDQTAGAGRHAMGINEHAQEFVGVEAEARTQPLEAVTAPATRAAMAAVGGLTASLLSHAPGSAAPDADVSQQRLDKERQEEHGTPPRLKAEGLNGESTSLTVTGANAVADVIDATAVAIAPAGNGSESVSGAEGDACDARSAEHAEGGSGAVAAFTKSVLAQMFEDGIGAPLPGSALPQEGTRADEVALSAGVQHLQPKAEPSLGAPTADFAKVPSALANTESASELAPLPQATAQAVLKGCAIMPLVVESAVASTAVECVITTNDPAGQEITSEDDFTVTAASVLTGAMLDPGGRSSLTAHGEDLGSDRAGALSSATDASQRLIGGHGGGGDGTVAASTARAAPEAPTDPVAAVGPAPGPASGTGHGILLQKLIMAGLQGARPLVAIAGRGPLCNGLSPPNMAVATASTVSTASGAANSTPQQPADASHSIYLDDFWQEYDIVYVINCETRYLSTYLQCDTMIDAVFFPNWDASVPPSRVALLLFNRDTDEVLGLWAAKGCDGKHVTWYLVRRLPAISKHQFHATSAGARVFPGLPYTTNSARALGQDTRDVLRVLAMHEATTSTGSLRAPPPVAGTSVVTAMPASNVRPSMGPTIFAAQHVAAAQVTTTVATLKPPSPSSVTAAPPERQHGAAPHLSSLPHNLLGRFMSQTRAAAAAAPGSGSATTATHLAATNAVVSQSYAAASSAPNVTAHSDLVEASGAAPAPPPELAPPLPPPPTTSFRTPLMMYLQQRVAAGPPGGADPANFSSAASAVPPGPSAAAPPAAESSPLGAPLVQAAAAPLAASVVPTAMIRPPVVPPAVVPANSIRPTAIGLTVRPAGVPVATGLPAVRPVTAFPAQPHIRPAQPVATSTQPMQPSPLPIGQVPIRVRPAGMVAAPRLVIPGMMPGSHATAGGAPALASIRSQVLAAPGAPTAPVAPLAASVVPGCTATATAQVGAAPTATAPLGQLARPRQPANSLLCAMCHQRTGGWVLLDCKHMAPCAECCTDPSMFGQLYPVCWCGANTESQRTHKVHLA